MLVFLLPLFFSDGFRCFVGFDDLVISIEHTFYLNKVQHDALGCFLKTRCIIADNLMLL